MSSRDRVTASVWLSLLASIAVASYPCGVQAQVIPDATLGTGNHSVTSTLGNRTDITGGLRRSSSLFHSFSQFNVNTLQQVYFANPAGIRNIFSRVTGGNLSTIDGTLGVAGAANLFLLNPSGIIFGPNARLDIAGSFFATTAEALAFPDGQRFAATGDRAVPLVEVNIPIGLQFGANPPAMITNRGVLATGQDLTLAAGNLDLQGQLHAGGNLTLNATDTVRVRDTVTEPFLARSGGALTVQGNQGIDILALNHPETPFVSGGNLSLISDGIVSGDAHFTSGGNFSIQNVSGGSGTFFSLYDPIIRVIGDVTFGAYSGASLKVEATGSIFANGNINITGPDAAPNPATDPEAAILSGGRALIMRAGVDPALIPAPTTLPVNNVPTLGTNFVVPAAPITPPGSITVTGNISTSDNASTTNDPVILSATGPITVNGLSPNRTSIFGGSITINTPADVNIAGNLFVRRDVVERSGDIEIGNLAVPSSVTIGGGISTRNLLDTLPAGFIRDVANPNNNPDGGDVSIRTLGAIRITGAFDTQTGNGIDPATLSPVLNPANVVSIASAARNGRGGNISLIAGGGIDLAAGITSASNFNGQGGSITLIGNATPNDLGNPALVTIPSLPDAINTTRGVIASRNDGTVIINPAIPNSAATFVPNPGIAGNVSITARTGDIRSGSVIASYSNSTDTGFARISLSADAGSVFLERARLSTSNLGSRDAGDIFIDADQLIQITNNSGAATVDLGTGANNLGIESEGTFGRIFIGSSPFAVGVVPDRVVIQNSNLSTQVLTRHTGDPINPQFSTPSRISVTAGEILIDESSLNTRNQTTVVNAGDISLIAQTGAVTITNGSQLISRNEVGTTVPNAARSDISVQGTAITIANSFIDASAAGAGSGGNILLRADNRGQVTIDRSGVRTALDITATGASGNIQVFSGRFDMSNGSRLDADNNSNVSIGGNVTIDATGAASLSGGSVISTSVGEGAGGNGGNITITDASSLSLTGGSGLSAQTSGTLTAGNAQAGNISISNVAGDIEISGFSTVGESSGLFTSTNLGQSGVGGNITINSPSSNLRITDRAILNATTSSISEGGDITVTVNRLDALSGGQLTTTATNTGAAGDITVIAPGGVSISGVAQPPAIAPSPFIAVTVTELTEADFSNAANGDIDSSTEIDHATPIIPAADGTTFPYFGFTVSAAGSVGIFDIDNGAETGGGAGSIDTELFLFNRDTGTLLAQNDDNFSSPLPGAGGSTSGLDSFIRYVFQAPGNYVIGVGEFNSFVSPGGLIIGNAPDVDDVYTLHISLQAPGTPSPRNPLQSQTSGIFAEAQGTSNAGNVTLNTPQLTMDNGAAIAASTQTGTAGNISINGGGSGQVTLSNGAQISGATVGGTGGTIDLAGLNTLQVTNSLIAASTTGDGGSAGAVTINANQSVTLDGTLSANQPGGISTQASNGNGSAGAITVNTSQLSIQNGAAIAASTQTGTAGNISINGGGSGQVTLSNGAQISGATVGGTGGTIDLAGLNTLQVTNSLIAASTTGDGGSAGAVTINANQSVTLDDTLSANQPGGISTQASNGNGLAGAITVNTSQLSIQNGAAIAASTDSGIGNNITLNGLNTLQLGNGSISASTQTGRAGSLTVNQGGTAANAITLSNGSALSLSADNPAGAGTAGSIFLNTRQLTVQGNSSVLAGTAGSGTAGNLTVSANGGTADAIVLSGGSFLALGSTGSGNAGNLLLDTRQLTLNDAAIAASTVSGTGGGITLQGLNTLALNNGQIFAETATGRAGNVFVTATDAVILNNGSVLSVAATNGGTAGNLTMNAGDRVRINNSEITVSSPSGQAGNLSIRTNDLRMNGGTIAANTGGGNGANININVGQGLLVMRFRSQIIADAGRQANGGNITINAPFIIGLTFENSDITANAVQGRGGNIDITTNGIFGLQFRPRLTPLSDITASSQFGLSGNVTLNTLNIEPTRGLTPPPIIFTDITDVAGSACEAIGAKAGTSSELRLTGRGGVPISPTATLPAQSTGSDWVSLELSPQVPIGVNLPDGTTTTLEPGEVYELQATCIRSWQNQQRTHI